MIYRDGRVAPFTITVDDPQPYLDATLLNETLYVSQPQWIGRALVTEVLIDTRDGIDHFLVTLQPIGSPST